MPTVFIALGSNLGPRLDLLKGAVEDLNSLPMTRVEAASPVYETEAVTSDESTGPPFLNAVLRLQTDLEPLDLLDGCLRIEREAGRIRTPGRKWEARSLDLDILAYDDRTIRTHELEIPHPRMGQRRFVLQPLADLAPELHLPDPYDVSVRYLLDRCRACESVRQLKARLLSEPDGR